MAATTISRTFISGWADDSGSNTDGTIIFLADWTDLLDAIDGMFSAAVEFGSTLRVDGASILFNSTTHKLTYGTGSPESAVTATIGSLYMRTNGGTGTTLYVKESGSGNTGWVAVAAGSVSVSGTPANNYLAVWTSASALEGPSTLQYDGSQLFIGDSANADITVGLTINQGANDNYAMAFKSSDIAHGMTSLAETDTYANFSKSEPAAGGFNIQAYAETGISYCLQFDARVTDATSVRSTAARAPVEFIARLKSGTSYTSIGANTNIAAFQDSATTRFILDSDGDSHQDVGTAWTNFHGHDDIGLITKLAAHVSRKDDPIRASFGKWLKTSRTELERLKLVTFNDATDGRPFVNMSKLTMLLVGAMQQQHTRMVALEARLLQLEGA